MPPKRLSPCRSLAPLKVKLPGSTVRTIVGLWWSQAENDRWSATVQLEMAIAVMEPAHLVH